MGWIVALLVLVGALAVWALSRGRGRAFILANVGSGGRSSPAPLPYARRSAFLSGEEREFLHCLEAALDGEARVFAKVRLEDIVAIAEGAKGKEKLVARNRIATRRVDFALCEPGSLDLLAAVDLEDGAPKSEREERGDAFKDACLRAAGLPLLRFDASKDFAAADVARWLATSRAPEIAALVEGPEPPSPDAAPHPLARIGGFFARRSRFAGSDAGRIPLQPAEGSDPEGSGSESEPAAHRESGDPSLN